MGVKQLQRPRLNAGQRPLIRIRELAFDSCGGHSVAVAGSAFICFRQELLQQPQIAGIVKLHQFCPVFQLCGGDSRELLHIYGVLGFVLQERNQKPFAFKVIRLLNAVAFFSVPGAEETHLVLVFLREIE